MKRLMHGENVIGEYSDDWTPPEGCDMDLGLKDGSMEFMSFTSEPLPPQQGLADQIIGNPDELAKLKTALGLA